MRDDANTYVGTPLWMSPEMIRANTEQVRNFQPIKSDIFSLGLIALYCLDTAEFEKQKNLNKNEIALQNYLDGFRLRFQAKNPGYMRFYYLLRCMVSFSPFSRPTILQIYEDFESILKEGYKPPFPNPGPILSKIKEMKFRVRGKYIFSINFI